MKSNIWTGLPLAAIALASLASGAPAQTAKSDPLFHDTSRPKTGTLSGNPMAKLPANWEALSTFGTRPAYSADGTKLLMLDQEFGTVYEMDIATRQVRSMTSHFPNNGFLRAHYLKDGNILLTGARQMERDEAISRMQFSEIFFLDKSGTKEAIPLDTRNFEGLAVSRISNRLVWAERSPGAARLALHHNVTGDQPNADEYVAFFVGDVVYNGGKPAIANKREIYRRLRSDCMAEPQDLRDNDQEVIFSCYSFHGDVTSKEGAYYDSSVHGVRLDTGKVTDYMRVTGENHEVEGIAPSGRWTLVECRDIRGGPSLSEVDLCKLDLSDPKKYTRLTTFSDYKGWRINNGVISPDGKTMAFMLTYATENSTNRLGIYLLHLTPEEQK
ncbi:hypothetical protein PQ455_02610 [Sphingomonas naphthae]|uniref:Phytase-like domain-containing protein n=1 Tax=Sphingomonas naphthae TaxID=1813468 RepID=A0ABY7TPM8_9SPHN|nr:hypothetical protein [Sphingomonas naphthae]WCT74144.1 hypothetical protein PQ455_02610 [Sphingomonas naphthae]